MSGFQFMPHVFDMISASPQANLNMDYNLWNSQLQRDSIMYMNPGFQASAFLDYPIFATFGNNLLDPSLAIQQTLHAFQNGNWMNGGCNNGNWFNNMFNNPWNNNINNNHNKPATVEDKLKQAEYEDLKKILQAYKDLNINNLNRKEKVEIDDALSKSGTLDEKLSAIKDALKKVPVAKLKSAVLSDEKLKAKLASCGYNLSNDKLNTTDDEDLMKNLDIVKKELGKSPAKYETLLSKDVCQGEENGDILRIISYWYDNNPGENIISMIANKINTNPGEGTDQSKAVNNLTMSLITKVNNIKANYSSSDLSKLDAAKKAVSDALDKVNGNNGFTKANLEDLAKKFDTLYAMLRIMEASVVSAEVKKDYQKLLKDSLGKDIIPNDFIVAETKADLKKEGVTIPADIDKLEEAQDNENKEVTKELLEAEGTQVKAKYKNNDAFVGPNVYKYNDKIYRIDSSGKVIDITDKVKIDEEETPAPPENRETPDKKLDVATIKTGEKTTIDNKDFYKYSGSFYLVKQDNTFDKGEKITAMKNGSKLRPVAQNYYKYDGVIYRIKDGKIEKAGSEITEQGK